MRLVQAWNLREEVEAFGGRPRVEYRPRVAERKADAVIERYFGNKAIIESLARAHGTRALMVWQPVPTYEYDLRYHVYDGNFGRHELTRVGYPRMKQRAEGRDAGSTLAWCADVQRDVRELLYVDQVHYSPDMSRRVAQCVVEAMVNRGLLQSAPSR